MACQIEYTPKASRFLRQLRDQALLRRITAAIADLSANPRPPGAVKLTGLPYYRIRIGDYRVIYRVEDDRLIVLVIDIGHRREIYR